ncbi:hypothetical protein H4S02_002501 [Coemansia sp. RSA 2611]|nr:hypothetical protein H4S01_004495 [Coemansia sp. RSA 2610]KAJ2389178.1 hypothetical protein H4S02_002501 [Coemansia sp. RSA 2611]
MSLFRNTSTRDTLQGTQTARQPSGPVRRPSLETLDVRDPTYYDVLKCTGEFSTPSAFFSRPIKPAHSSDRAYPWAARPADVLGDSKVGNKHRLRRAAGDAAGSASAESVAASSSQFPAHRAEELPPSVFRLPGARTAAGRDRREEPWALSGMTAGGRALRKASQAPLSRLDRKVSLV